MTETAAAGLLLRAEDVLAPLTELADFIGSFVAFPSPEARDALALWVAHCHAIDAAATTPRLSIRSPEKQSGKTRLIEVLDLVVPRSIFAVNLSVPVLFRSIGDPPPTVLWDEADALFRGRMDPGREDLRALLNSGYRRGATVRRMVGEGKRMKVETFQVFAPVALAGIGNLPDTLNDRSIVVELRRRLADERVRAFRRRLVEQESASIRERVNAWATDHLAELERARPVMPVGLSDRAADLWEPLLAIADAAGGTWPDRARKSADALAQAGRDADGSSGVKLLSDLRDVFAARRDSYHLPTAELVETLTSLEESPWGDLRGRPLDARGLARRLRPFGIRPQQQRYPGGVNVRSYLRADLEEAWARYCPSPPGKTATTATTATEAAPELGGVADRSQEDPLLGRASATDRAPLPLGPGVADEPPVQRLVEAASATEPNPETPDVAVVAVVADVPGGKAEGPRSELVRMARRHFPGSRHVGTKRHPQPAPDGVEEVGVELSDEGLWASFAAEAGLSA